jgi:amino acid adenylation domain-containing protein
MSAGSSRADNLVSVFERWVERTPDQLAVESEKEALTYRQLDDAANGLAHRLAGAGVGHGDRVVVAVQRSVEGVVGLLAALKVGAAYVMVDPADPPAHVEFVLTDTGARIVVARAASADALGAHGVPVLPFELDAVRSRGGRGRDGRGTESADVLAGRAVPPDALAYVMYTSGSTGRPKGVMIEHRHVLRRVEGAASLMPSRGEAMLQVSRLDFDAQTWEIWGALTAGARLVVAPTYPDPENIARLIDQKSVDVALLSPGLFRQLVETHLKELGLPRLLLVGGDVMSPVHAQRFIETHTRTPLVNLFGPTEVTVCGSFHHVQRQSVDEAVPIGRALGNTLLYLLDDTGTPVADGEVGELFIGGSCVGRGYLNRPDDTAQRFLPDPFDDAAGSRMYRTGDRARLRPDGALEFLGRSDDQVKIRGFRIEPAEIEACVRAAPGVAEVVVVQREDLPGHRRLVAYVVFEAGQRGDLAALREHVASRLPAHMVPSAFVALGELPLTPRGKVDRAALPRPSDADADRERRPPQTTTERVVADIWKRVLELDELGIEEQFLELGGDSLLAVRVVVAVREELGVELSLRDVFDDGTVERLSSRIDQGGGTAPLGALPGLARARRHRGSVPVTKTQAQTCLISEMAEEALPYQFQACIAFHGRLDVEALVEALNGVVARHELLRTRFVRRQSGWRQIVVPELRVPVQVVDVRTADYPSVEFQRIVDELVSERIAIGTLPLVRWRIVRLADDHHVLVHVEHHLVHDGWSWTIFLRDLAVAYSARVDASMRPPAPLECQFRDFSQWQAGIGASEAGKAQLAYWKERLRDQGPPLLLPSDRPRPRRMSYRGSRILFTVPDDLADRLRAQSRDLGATLFMSMLTAFYVLLHRYSDQEDIVVGSGVANRRLPPFENLIGMLLNTVALRADLSGDPTVDELLFRVRQSTLDAFAHQDLPFEDVLEAVRPARQAGTAPLYQVLFSFQDPPVVDMDLPGVTVVPDDTVGNDSAKADLNVVVVNRRADTGSLSIVWEYSTDLFDETTAQAMLDSYLELLEVLFGDPSARLSQVPMLSREQRDVVTTLAGPTSTYERESAIAQVFEARVAEDPQAPALAWDGGSATYDEVNRGANRLAHRFADFGVGPGTCVAVAMERSAPMVEVLLGILKAGAAYVALDTSQPPSRLRAVIDDARPAVICTTSAVQTELPVSDIPVFLVDAEALDAQPETNPPRGVAAPDPAYVAYTSGTSGVPKGVAVPQRAVVRLVRGTDYASFDRSETFLLFAPIAFDASTFEIWGPLLNGARLAVAPRGPVGPDELAQVVDRLGVTTLWLTAGLFHQVVEHAPATFGRLRQLLAGGDVLAPEAVARALRALPAGAVLVNGYGPTEGTTFTCCHRMEAGSSVEGVVPIGKPIANTRVYITDRGGALVPRGVPGELVIGGDGLALGYLGDPALTATRFVPDRFGPDRGGRLYRTGDRARWRPDGTIEFLGRIDRQVKVRGFRIEPEAVERALLEHPAVREALVVPQDVPEGRRLFAYVTPSLDGDTTGRVRDELRQRLAPYELPSVIISLDALPLNANGKLEQSALPPPPSGPSSTRDGASATADALEQQLLETWREVLGVPALGPEDDFFDSGGHSLLAVTLFARIEQNTGVRLPLSTIFEAPTVRELEKVLRSNGWDVPGRPLASLTVTGSRSPLFFVTAGDGNSVGFGALARRLGPEQPFYALQPRGMDGRRVIDVGVTKLARRYVRDIRGIQAHGPYILGGRCFGTLVAFEMTRILEAASERVSLLIALDSVGPLWKPRKLANGMVFDEAMNLACYLHADAPSRDDIFSDPGASDAFIAWLREPVEVRGPIAVNRYVHTAYRARPDLQAAYPLGGGQHAGLLHWAWVGGRSEMGLNPALLPDPSPVARRAPQSRDPRYRTPVQRLRARGTDWLDVATRGRVSTLATRRQDRLLELAARMVLEYRAGPCNARIALIRSEEYRNDAQVARWYGLVTGGIEEHYVLGSHQSMMREPDVSSLARSVEELVAGA